MVAPGAVRVKATRFAGALRAALTRTTPGAFGRLAGAGKRACLAEQGNVAC